MKWRAATGIHSGSASVTRAWKRTAEYRAWMSTGAPAAAASAGAPVDIQARYSAVRFQALVTDAEPECMPVAARHFIIGRGAVGERVRDDHVAEDAPIVHALPVEVRVAFQNRIVLDCAGYAIGNMRCLMSLGPVGAVAGLVDFQPDLVDCLEPVF